MGYKDLWNYLDTTVYKILREMQKNVVGYLRYLGYLTGQGGGETWVNYDPSNNTARLVDKASFLRMQDAGALQEERNPPYSP
jgi:hypothetical protein